MHGELVPWLFEDSRLVRSVERNEEPWFVGLDVCEALELAKPHQALSRLDADERGTCSVGTPGGAQSMVVISEPGVFRLVFGSRKPVAERFKRWLAHEVLPSLRRTGRYEMHQAEAQPTPIVSRTFEDWTPAELNSKIGAVAEYRMSIGPHAGRWALQRFGLPMPPDSVMRGRQFELDLRPNP